MLQLSHVDLLSLPPELFQADLDLEFEARCATLKLTTPIRKLAGATCCAILAVRHVDYDLSDTHIDAARWRVTRSFILQATDFMSPQDQAKLLAYVQHAGRSSSAPACRNLNATAETGPACWASISSMPGPRH